MKSTIRALLVASATSLVMSGAALAADLRGSLMPATYAPSWTGYYFGVNGGYAWADEPVVFDSAVGLRTGATGGLIGGQVGFNWQYTPDWVFGVETDLDWADIYGATRTLTPYNAAAAQRVDMLGTLRGRVGYVLEDVLLYGTAGIAYGETELMSSACGPFGFCDSVTSRRWKVGWAAGVGFDWAFLPHWSFRSEYLHYDLGSQTHTLTDPFSIIHEIDVSSNFRGDVVRGAINFKFR
jgi:outer membrane immunogenic protein